MGVMWVCVIEKSLRFIVDAARPDRMAVAWSGGWPADPGHPQLMVRLFVAGSWAAPYAINSAKAHVLPGEGNKDLGEGYLFITNKRLFFKGENRSAAVEYSPKASLFLYSDGIRIERSVGNTLLRFKSRSDETAEIAGELLAALMR